MIKSSVPLVSSLSQHVPSAFAVQVPIRCTRTICTFCTVAACYQLLRNLSRPNQALPFSIFNTSSLSALRLRVVCNIIVSRGQLVDGLEPPSACGVDIYPLLLLPGLSVS